MTAVPQSRLRGALIAIFGVVCVSPSATLMRLIVARTGASNNLLVFYKSLIKIFLILGVIVWSKGFKEAYRGACRGPKFVLLASAAQACIDLGFSNMILLTTVARAMLFYSLNPLFAAVVGRLLLKDELRWRTVAALAGAAVAISLIFIPQILFASGGGGGGGATSGSEDAEEAQSDLGDFIAVGTGFAMAMYITVVRAAHRSDPEIYMVPAASGGSILAACITGASLAAGVVEVTSTSNVDDNGGGDSTNDDDVDGSDSSGSDSSPFLPAAAASEFWGLIFVDAACVAVMLVCLTLAPRSLSGAEVSLITLLETVLGPVMVFVALGEAPAVWTAAGGALLLCTLVLHECAQAGAFNKGKDEDENNDRRRVDPPPETFSNKAPFDRRQVGDAEEEEGELGEPPPGSTTSRGGKERQFPCDEDAVSASALELVVENNERSLL